MPLRLTKPGRRVFGLCKRFFEHLRQTAWHAFDTGPIRWVNGIGGVPPHPITWPAARAMFFG